MQEGGFVKKRVLIGAVAIGLMSPVIAVPASATAPAEAPNGPSVGSIAWSPCPTNDPVLGALLKGLECGSLDVPMNYKRPGDRKLTLALTRAKHTASDAQYQGIVLLNRGQWPGQIGRDLPVRYANGTVGLPISVASTYDWIGFDPRGVGASEPMLACDPSYVLPGQPDVVPSTAAEEQVWLDRARAYADSCDSKYGDVLRYLSTEDTARDLDLIRQALGQEQINYLGYDYGSYLGSVYASMFPDRVRRMVLDSVVRPSGVWYENNLDQNVALEKRAKIFFAWIAKYDSIYHLGTTAAEVEANYYKGMAMVREAPIDGKIGTWEYTDVFAIDLYRNYGWANHAKVLADWVLRQNPAGLRAAFTNPGYPHENRQAMYNAVQCRDAHWPQSWHQWREDYTRQHNEGNTFMTWKDAWYNAPCLFWPVPASQPVPVGNPDVNVLLVQPENDPAHGVAGAYEVRQLFPNSRLILELDGNNIGASLSANADACLNSYVTAYFRDGSRPASTGGTDAYCQANPGPVPPGA